MSHAVNLLQGSLLFMTSYGHLAAIQLPGTGGDIRGGHAQDPPDPQDRL